MHKHVFLVKACQAFWDNRAWRTSWVPGQAKNSHRELDWSGLVAEEEGRGEACDQVSLGQSEPTAAAAVAAVAEASLVSGLRVVLPLGQGCPVLSFGQCLWVLP